MSGLAYVHMDSSLPGSGFTFTGDLNVKQKQPIGHRGRDNRFKEPIFSRESVFADEFDFAKTLRDYQNRNGTFYSSSINT